MRKKLGKLELHMNTFKIAATYMGTIVGAGFASGQEVLQYFNVYGTLGLGSILITTLLFAFFGYTILILGHKLQAKSHLEVIRFANGKTLGFIVDLIITIFLFGALSAMIAGAGAVFQEQFGWSPLLGNLIMALAALLTVALGISGVINAISYVVPVLLASILFVAIYSLTTNPIVASDWAMADTLSGAAPHWIVSSVNYISYNLVIAVAILAPMGARTTSTRTLLWGAIWGGLSLGIGITCIYLSILTDIESASQMEIPMIQIAANISSVFQMVFSVILFAEIYTTAVGNLYGFVARISQFLQVKSYVLMIFATGAAFGVAQFGFSNMVKYLYPSVGYGGMILLLGLAIAWLFRRKSLSDRV